MTTQTAPSLPARKARIVGPRTGTVLGLRHRLALAAIGRPWWRSRQVRRRAAAA